MPRRQRQPKYNINPPLSPEQRRACHARCVGLYSLKSGRVFSYEEITMAFNAHMQKFDALSLERRMRLKNPHGDY